MKQLNDPRKLDAIEAARLLNRRLGYVYLLLREGKLQAERVDGRWQIDPTAVERFIAVREKKRRTR